MTPGSADPAGQIVERGRYLIGRPARQDDLERLKELVRPENIASLRPQFQQSKISRSKRTLESSSWDAGSLFLVTELWSDDGSAMRPVVVGCSNLNRGGGGYWRRIDGSGDLIFEIGSDQDTAMELGGNCVASAYRRAKDFKIGKFQTTARLAFLLEHEKKIGEVSTVFANLLTIRNGNAFPFYDNFVGPRLGGKDYDRADIERYEDPTSLAPLVGQRLSLTDVEASLGTFGTVRNETMPARTILDELGFKQISKFDALDGGMYMELPVAALSSAIAPRELPVQPDRRQIGADAPKKLIFPPLRSMADFSCACAPAYESDGALLIDQLVLEQLGLNAGETVMLVGADCGPARD